MKKKLFAIIALLVILTGIVAGTVAYFTGSATAHNVITSGHIDIDLVETKLDEKDTDNDGKTDDEIPYPTTDVTGIMPGVTTSKIVRVYNRCDNPAWVRVKVEVKIGRDTIDPTASNSVLAIDFDNTKWEKNGNYYYYTEKLEKNGDKTIPLFTSVKLLEAADNAYQNAEITINVTADGIQSQNNELAEGDPITSVWPTWQEILAYPFVGR